MKIASRIDDLITTVDNGAASADKSATRLVLLTVVLVVLTVAIIVLTVLVAFPSTETCVRPVPDKSLYSPSPGATITTCSRHFWWAVLAP